MRCSGRCQFHQTKILRRSGAFVASMAVIDLPNRGVRSVFGSPERGWFEWGTVGRHSRGFDRLTRPLHVQRAARLDISPLLKSGPSLVLLGDSAYALALGSC